MRHPEQVSIIRTELSDRDYRAISGRRLVSQKSNPQQIYERSIFAYGCLSFTCSHGMMHRGVGSTCRTGNNVVPLHLFSPSLHINNQTHVALSKVKLFSILNEPFQ